MHKVTQAFFSAAAHEENPGQTLPFMDDNGETYNVNYMDEHNAGKPNDSYEFVGVLVETPDSRPFLSRLLNLERDEPRAHFVPVEKKTGVIDLGAVMPR